MAHHDFHMPIDEKAVRALAVGDTVTLEGTLYGIRDATQIQMFDHGRKTRFDLAGHAVIHTAPNVRKVPVSAAAPSGYEPVCVGTTTSARMERFTLPLMRECGVRLIIGKGGLGADSQRAFADLGGAYLAIIGGAAALETTWIEAIEDVDLDDLNPESLWRFRVKGFGPLLVAMDARGGSLYDGVHRTAASRRARALAALGVKETESPSPPSRAEKDLG
jgi:L(+)-tartrate dehydratase beta subunit